MKLVDYSDSESETEVVSTPAPQPQVAGNASKKPSFQKVVDRAKPGKILVNLPGSSVPSGDNSNTSTEDEPPAKRARITRSGAFSGFNSFLPPPKNVGKKSTASATTSGSDQGQHTPRPGVNLKTGAAPAFSRTTEEEQDHTIDDDKRPQRGSGMSLPAPKLQQPTIPEGQKPAEEVELVGKPLMFKPLSVSRKKPSKKATPIPKATTSTPIDTVSTTQAAEVKAEPPPKKKISLFSISDDNPQAYESHNDSNDAYEPLISTVDTPETSTADAFAAYDAQYSSYAAPTQATTVSSVATGGFNSLDSIASDMNLSAAARRELFGRRGAPSTDIAAARVINFDTEREYAHNEVLRANGEQQIHNPVRSIAPGKHNLRQLVNQVHTQREALEESFAKGKAKQSEAGSRYGWR
ncbi:hypothetical protein GGS21DRAFT_477703 [Xylaria nigripes]|nr:hypothetical protein GGS21DRAFT_477703 [Xylaria nigripes]